MEAQALSQQIDSVALSLAGGVESEVEPHHRQQALDALLQLQRLNQLKAIASSPSNSTYFFGDKSALEGPLAGNSAYSIDFLENAKGGHRSGKSVGKELGTSPSLKPHIAASLIWMYHEIIPWFVLVKSSNATQVNIIQLQYCTCSQAIQAVYSRVFAFLLLALLMEGDAWSTDVLHQHEAKAAEQEETQRKRDFIYTKQGPNHAIYGHKQHN
jgi:hypothetical protein